MKRVAVQAIKQPVVVEITCDRCNKSIDAEDVLEAQEWICIHIDGGYSSIFGDGARLTCDLCQECVKALLGPFLKPVRDPDEQEQEDQNESEVEENEISHQAD